MSIIRNFLFFFLFLLTVSCNANDNQFLEPFKKVKCRKVQRRVAKEFESRIEKQGFDIKGVGGGSTQDGRKRLVGYTLGYPQISSIEEARILIVGVVLDYLSQLNEQKGVEQCLVEYPFPPERLNFTIIADSSSPNTLSGVSSWLGKVCYFEFEQDSIRNLNEIHEETFAEAKAIMEAEGSKTNSSYS